MFETRNELEGFRWTGESYVNFFSFLFSAFGLKDGRLDKTGQISAAIWCQLTTLQEDFLVMARAKPRTQPVFISWLGLSQVPH